MNKLKKECKLNKKHIDYFYWIKLKALDQIVWSKAYPNKHRKIINKVLKKFNSLTR
tara:strand:+ start:473 stop:640 length:168 start_codon:yes stop_codon:yes gene_type:complete